MKTYGYSTNVCKYFMKYTNSNESPLAPKVPFVNQTSKLKNLSQQEKKTLIKQLPAD